MLDGAAPSFWENWPGQLGHVSRNLDIFVQSTKCQANLKTNDSSGSSENQTQCQESDASDHKKTGIWKDIISITIVFKRKVKVRVPRRTKKQMYILIPWRKIGKRSFRQGDLYMRKK